MEKEISKIKDYRRKFKRYYNINYSNEYVIHHIDLNHDNNDINNLMILPKKLHQLYHYYLNVTGWNREEKYTREISVKITGNEISGNAAYDEAIIRLLGIISECRKWYDYKQYLDGKLPNIHGIILE